MAKFTTYNPAVEEALSAPIASMSNAISLMSDALNLGTTAITDETMSEVYISDTDRYRIFAVDLNKRGWLETPAPVIKMNGTVITPTTNGFEINYLGGCINFLSDTSKPTSSDVITASFTYVNGTSATINGINTSVSALTSKTANYRGSFDSLTALESGVANPQQYDYAYVFGAVSDIYFYDYTNSDWVSVTENDVAGLQTQINALDSGKENVIGTKNTAFNKNFGTGNEEVMRGDYAYSKSATDTAIATKEPIISDKGTAFNKDFGTEADTVMQGDYAYSKEDVDEMMETLNYTGAGTHNSIYRGKDLGTSVTAEQYENIANGTFKDMYIGDYWTINSKVYRIAAFDYYYHCGDTDLTTHHVTLVPDEKLYNAQMHNTESGQYESGAANTTEGGYVGSDMYTTNLESAKTTIAAAFGNHLLEHKQYLVNAVTSGRPSGAAWFASKVELMNEIMVYGTNIFSPVSDGSTVPKVNTVCKTQLPLFALRPDAINFRESYWLRDVVSAAHFANATNIGYAYSYNTSYPYGVRPAFSIY